MLETTDRRAVVAQLVKRMRANGQWAGETHIQKALFFLQSMLKLPSPYKFVLYKHGPYSFDLHDDLGNMRANLVLDVKPQRPYGASFELGELGDVSIQRGKNAVDRYNDRVEFVVGSLGNKDVRTLEQYATALFVKIDNPNSDNDMLKNIIMDLKPHISERLASEAIQSVVKIESDARVSGLELSTVLSPIS